MITSHHASRFAVRSQERGAILVISLLLLLVLTIIGVSVMQMTRMQERMSGNSSDVNVAFQGGESGLRGAESKTLTFATRPKTCVTMGTICDSVFKNDTVGALNTKQDSFWDANAIKFSDPNIGAQFKQEPQFLIEELAFVPYSKEYGDTTGRDFYQTTGRSTGASGTAVAVVQSTFARQSY